jgi:hypothetical protein
MWGVIGTYSQSQQWQRKHRDHSVSLQCGIDPAAMRLYGEYYGNCDVWMRKAAPLIYTGWLGTSEQLSPFEQLARSEFYNDYLRPNDMAHAMWGVIGTYSQSQQWQRKIGTARVHHRTDRGRGALARASVHSNHEKSETSLLEAYFSLLHHLRNDC